MLFFFETLILQILNKLKHSLYDNTVFIWRYSRPETLPERLNWYAGKEL